MLSRLKDIDRLVRLSVTQYDEATEAYQEAERVARKKAAASVGSPEYAHLCMVQDKARQQAEDLYKEAKETTRRVERARECFKKDYPNQYTGWM